MSFLRDYHEFATNNEAPQIFHTWGAYVCLSAAIQRRVWIPYCGYNWYPNIYVILVGKAGNGKSHAMRHARWVLSKLGDIPLSGNIETPEGLLRFMAGQPDAKPTPIPSPVKKVFKGIDGQFNECFPMTIMANEFINFISQNDTGWVAMLNDIWDQDVYFYRTKGQGQDYIKGPYIVLFGALTTEVAASLHKAQIIETGLGRRTLMQHGVRQWDTPNEWPTMSPAELAARERCVEWLKQLRSVTGEFQRSNDAIVWWKKWYGENLREVPKKAPNVQGWFGTKADQLIKLAMLTALSESRELVLEQSHFELSLEFLGVLEQDLPKVFGGSGRNELAAVAQRIFEYINFLDKPETKESLRSKFFNDCKPPAEFNDCLNFLVDSQQIKLLDVQIGTGLTSLIATPLVMAHYVLRVKDAKPDSVSADVITWADETLANPLPVPVSAPDPMQLAVDQAAEESVDGTRDVASL